jgi:CspA family cold shock protein
MTIGTVKVFNAKGFGFITPEGGAKDVFVHARAIEAAGMNRLSEGQRVSFDVQPDARGQKAVNLKRVQRCCARARPPAEREGRK